MRYFTISSFFFTIHLISHLSSHLLLPFPVFKMPVWYSLHWPVKNTQLRAIWIDKLMNYDKLSPSINKRVSLLPPNPSVFATIIVPTIQLTNNNQPCYLSNIIVLTNQSSINYEISQPCHLWNMISSVMSSQQHIFILFLPQVAMVESHPKTHKKSTNQLLSMSFYHLIISLSHQPSHFSHHDRRVDQEERMSSFF